MKGVRRWVSGTVTAIRSSPRSGSKSAGANVTCVLLLRVSSCTLETSVIVVRLGRNPMGLQVLRDCWSAPRHKPKISSSCEYANRSTPSKLLRCAERPSEAQTRSEVRPTSTCIHWCCEKHFRVTLAPIARSDHD